MLKVLHISKSRWIEADVITPVDTAAMKHLTSLHLDTTPIEMWDLPPNLCDLNIADRTPRLHPLLDTADGLHHLTRLTLSCDEDLPTDIRLLPQLKSLSFSAGIGLYIPTTLVSTTFLKIKTTRPRLPTGLDALAALRHLIIEFADVQPFSIDELTVLTVLHRLEELRIKSPAAVELPAGLSLLTDLTRLHLFHENEFHVHPLAGCSNLTRLELNCPTGQLPDGLTALTALECLTINNCGTCCIAQSILLPLSSLRRLSDLSVISCGFRVCPPTLLVSLPDLRFHAF